MAGPGTPENMVLEFRQASGRRAVSLQKKQQSVAIAYDDCFFVLQRNKRRFRRA